MREAAAVRYGREEDVATGTSLFAAVGEFLDAHGLGPEPVNYRFAYSALTDPTMIAAVGALTDGGLRLNRQAIEQLGGIATPRRAAAAAPATTGRDDQQAARLVAETQAQVDGFATLMRAIQDETSDFGRDLLASAARIGCDPDMNQVARVTGAMIARLRETEQRLAQATDETDTLRTKLAEARDVARRDPLTGLANRLAFEEAFHHCGENVGSCCLALCDVDHFKRLNDEHGHAVGDRVLSAIGSGLAEACEGHLVARHGGEEFAILLHGLSLEGAAAVLDGAREQLADRRFRNRETDGSLGQVTMSVGVTAVRPGEAADLAFARADDLLYAAKAQGRDRICSG